MGWLILVPFWIGCGVLCAMLAKNKNREPEVWFAIGFLFGPFGLLAAFIVEENVEERGTSLGALGGAAQKISHRPCPYCAEDVRAEAIKCRFCGSDIEPAAARCDFCAQVIALPKVPCAAADEETIAEQAPLVTNSVCRSALAAQGFIDPIVADG